MFTQPCFIRKNTPELRKKLEELGYNRYPRWMADWGDDDSRCVYLVTDVLYYTYPQEPTKPKNGEHIDCGENEELFLALTALRDDTDKDQWFTNGTDWAIWREEDSFRGKPITGFEFHYLPSSIDYDNYHKATVEEIIEHFKEK